MPAYRITNPTAIESRSPCHSSAQASCIAALSLSPVAGSSITGPRAPSSRTSHTAARPSIPADATSPLLFAHTRCTSRDPCAAGAVHSAAAAVFASHRVGSVTNSAPPKAPAATSRAEAGNRHRADTSPKVSVTLFFRNTFLPVTHASRTKPPTARPKYPGGPGPQPQARGRRPR